MQKPDMAANLSSKTFTLLHLMNYNNIQMHYHPFKFAKLKKKVYKSWGEKLNFATSMPRHSVPIQVPFHTKSHF